MSAKQVFEPLDDIARRCFKADLRYTRKKMEVEFDQAARGCVSSIGGLVACVLAVAGLGAVVEGELGFAAFVMSLSGLLAWRILKWRRDNPLDKYVSNRLKAFRAGDPEVVLKVQHFAVEHFREKIQSHRARTLGSYSEWGMARTSLSEALDEARQSVAYWRLRSQEDDGKDFTRRQHEVAARLQGKLRGALRKLDSRADVLLQFYNDCDARLAVMDRYNQDMVETRRLESLSDRADLVIAEAEGALAAIGRQFVDEAQRVGRALAGLADAQVLSLAGEAPLDDMEALADRIIERSESDEETIRELDAALGRGV